MSFEKVNQYRAQSEALHQDTTTHFKYYDNLVMITTSGYKDLIRKDFYDLLDYSGEDKRMVLDAGCGTGLDASNLKSRFPKMTLYGVDISAVSLSEAARRSEEGLHFFISGLEAMPFADGAFDILISHEVIEHVEDPALVLAEFHRVLNDGGQCVIATPNGASLAIEHLRQRVARLFGKRGAPVGSDHVRPGSFWRTAARAAGFVVEEEIYDGAAIEFQTYACPASWMPLTSRVLEPLRVLPMIRWLICDRVKFRLRKKGELRKVTEPVLHACPVCRERLDSSGDLASCPQGHNFARSTIGFFDFTRVVAGPGNGADFPDRKQAPTDNAEAAAEHPPKEIRPRSLPVKVFRRTVRWALTGAYIAFLTILAPVGAMIGVFHQPFRALDRDFTA